MRTGIAVCLALLLGGVAQGCSDESSCFAGDLRSCSCEGGALGTQTCLADGAWSSCSCGGADGDADTAADGDADGDTGDRGDRGETPWETEGTPPDDGADAEDAPPPPPCNQHTFRYVDATATSVWVTGTFTAWAATLAAGAIDMTRGTDGETWEATVLVEPPGRHEYKFIVDGTTWVPDPDNPDRVPDGYGSYNSVIWLCEEACDPAEFDWRDAVLYFAMVDRFHDSDGRSDPVSGASGGDARSGPSGQYAGGDLAGVEAKIPYLADLGVTAIWLSAPYENRNSAGAAVDPSSDSHMYSGYHGYWPSPDDVDYSVPSSPAPRPRVESRIGTEDDLRSLVEAAHAAGGAGGHGIKVLFDYVMKHVDIESGLYLAHADWWCRRGGEFALCGPEGLWDDPYWGTRCAFTDYLAPFDFELAAPRDWSVNDAVWWATTFGIDGYRLDAIKHVPNAWLTGLRTRLGAAFPAPAGGRFYLVGETFAYDDPGLIRSFVDPATKLDGQFDFPLKARLCEAVFSEGGRMDTLAGWMATNDGYYGAGAIMSTFIGNHDLPRAIHFASRQIGNCREGSWVGNSWTSDFRQPSEATPYERLGVAFAVLLTNPGIPLLYYGDEIGLAGGGDPDNRRMMPWDDGSLNAHQIALRERVSALAGIRAAHPVIGRGRRETIASDADTWVYRMTGCTDGADVIVALNRADSARDVTIPAGSYTDLVADSPVDGGARSLPPRSFLVLGPR
jgi:glycosidase